MRRDLPFPITLIPLPIRALRLLRLASAAVALALGTGAHVVGVLLHCVPEGAHVDAGQQMFVVVDPLDGTRTPVYSRTDGVFYMRRDVRHVRAGEPPGRASGARAIRSGYLPGA